jgi:hypothetical protein
VHFSNIDFSSKPVLGGGLEVDYDGNYKNQWQWGGCFKASKPESIKVIMK